MLNPNLKYIINTCLFEIVTSYYVYLLRYICILCWGLVGIWTHRVLVQHIFTHYDTNLHTLLCLWVHRIVSHRVMWDNSDNILLCVPETAHKYSARWLQSQDKIYKMNYYKVTLLEYWSNSFVEISKKQTCISAAHSPHCVQKWPRHVGLHKSWTGKHR